MPSLLTALLAALAIADPDVDPEPLAAAATEATEHGRVRAVEGFPIGVLLAEFHHLRAEVEAAVLRIVEDDPAATSTLAEMQSRLTSTFGTLAVATAEGWAAALDWPH